MRRLQRLSILAACVGASVAIATTGVAMAVTPGASIRDGGPGYRSSERANASVKFPNMWKNSISEVFRDFEFVIDPDEVATPKGVRDRTDSVLVKFSLNSGLDAIGLNARRAR